jgi:glycosyltransferase involved in cell wall biosynthesis
MKIAHLVSTFPPHIGGMGQVCFEEAARLSGDHEITVVTLDYGGPALDEDVNGFKVRRLRPPVKYGDAGYLTGLEKILRGFDIVHLHYPFYGALGALIRAKKLLGFSLVVTYHMDAQSDGLKKYLQNIFDWFYSKKLFQLADRVIVIDLEYFKQSKFGRYIGKEKSIVVPNGVDTEMFCPGTGDWPRLNLPTLAGKKTILFVGNLLPVKNVVLLIDILPNLPPDACLVIVGGGYNEKYIRQYVTARGLADKVVFAGVIPDRKDLVEYYRSAFLVAVPSRSESFSLVVAEAMACGAVVVASDIPGIRGRITDGRDGFFAPVDDQSLWQKKIADVFIMPDEEKNILRGRAREKALSYDWNKHVRALRGIYRGCL